MTENSQKLKDSVVQSAQNSAGIGDGAGDVTAALSPHEVTREDVELWRAGNAAALDAAGMVMDAEQCRQGQFDDLAPAKVFQQELALHRAAILTSIETMMLEFVTNWPSHKRLSTSVALISKTIRAALNPEPHKYWGAGEADCPIEIKAGNGELHTLRCKVCGEDDPRDKRCPTITPSRHNEPPDEGWFEEVISDTLDMDWRPRDAAKAIVRRWNERWYPEQATKATQP